MLMNRIQTQIFKKLSAENKLSLNEYVSGFSEEFVGYPIQNIEDLTEEEADTWITKAYLKSLG